jgi:hypothetical protein
MATDRDKRIDALESKVAELEALVNLALRLLAIEKPVSALLERYGATERQDLAVHQLLSALADRADRGGLEVPSFGGFINDLNERFPAARGDREFVSLLLDSLKLDRPAYQKLHAYIAAQGWPQWT